MESENDILRGMLGRRMTRKFPVVGVKDSRCPRGSAVGFDWYCRILLLYAVTCEGRRR